jgi:hypothetical protein
MNFLVDAPIEFSKFFNGVVSGAVDRVLMFLSSDQ